MFVFTEEILLFYLIDLPSREDRLLIDARDCREDDVARTKRRQEVHRISARAADALECSFEDSPSSGFLRHASILDSISG